MAPRDSSVELHRTFRPADSTGKAYARQAGIPDGAGIWLRVACLGGGLALVPVMIVRPDLWPSLRLLHMHLNTLGFVGLTAIGTLQVLMPTILSGPDVEASVRLRQDLPLALLGVVLIAIGAAFWWPLSLFGSASLGYVVTRLGWAGCAAMDCDRSSIPVPQQVWLAR